MTRVSALFTYPVKSCRAAALERASLDRLGIEHDRRFVFSAEDNVAVTQRDQPLLATIVPQLEVGALGLDLGGLAALAVSLDSFRAPSVVDVWGRRIPGFATDTIAVLDEYLGARVRLIMLDPTAERSFADSRPVLVATTGMLGALGLADIPMERFRPNIVLEGDTASRELRGDEVSLAFEKPCGRCEVTTIDQSTGARSGPEPLRTLNERFAGNFGTYYRVARPGALRRGEVVTGT